jgi:SAM-dependent methyltransferase
MMIAAIHHLQQPFLGNAAEPLGEVEEHFGTLPDLDAVDGIVSFGGEQSAWDEALRPEVELIREAVQREIPFLGVCLGAQLLAHAHGGAVSRLPRRRSRPPSSAPSPAWCARGLGPAHPARPAPDRSSGSACDHAAPMPVPDAIAYVRAALPPPPARVLEVGAGDGELAVALSAAGYDVTAIDPKGGDGVLQVALADLDAAPRSFDAAVAMLSLHHVVPLGQSLRRLSEVLRHGARLVVDEFDVDRFDERASAWWLWHRDDPKDARDHVAEMHEHLHPIDHVREELAPWFDLGEPVPGAYLYRWHIDPALRSEEEELIASGELPAVGTRFVAVRR